MKKIVIFCMLVLITAPTHASDLWSSLWRNPDQLGDTYMQQGDPGNAAKTYTDPRRRAYAKLNAGDYTGAAQDLDKLHDSDAHYNRGNALAYAGELQAALDAYDAALKIDANNQDAKHNRELVANALKQQPAQKSGGNKSKDEDKKEGEQNRQADQDKQGDTGQKDTPEKSQQTENKSGKGQDASAQNKSEQTAKDGKDKSNQHQPSAQAESKADQGKDAAKNDAEQARRELEARKNKPASNGKNATSENLDAIANKTTATPPKSEQQIAQEQWLRSIPEDPGGLLRRKFLIEHAMRQQKANK